uniref:DUF805 domain-containing protein n=1 Tax=Candidatus Desulfovibrio trichonymphae TaxID=1725232 RepID=UPI0015556626|nr:DUF805 domain-containing protein [Candidatus Desulfovibrio trichonymphae]
MLFPATTGVTVRRFHDLNASGWIFLVWIILLAIPVVGFFTWIAFLLWFCFQGTEGENKYGADPLCADTHYNESKAQEERQRRKNEERARREAEREKVRRDQDAGREQEYTGSSRTDDQYEILGVRGI